MKSSRLVTALSGSTATEESSAIDVKYAKKVTLLCTRAANAGGTSTFSATGSIDGTTYVALFLITNAATTNAQTVTRAASVAIANDNASILAALDLENGGYHYIKVKNTETTDGTASITLLIEEE